MQISQRAMMMVSANENAERVRQTDKTTCQFAFNSIYKPRRTAHLCNSFFHTFFQSQVHEQRTYYFCCCCNCVMHFRSFLSTHESP